MNPTDRKYKDALPSDTMNRIRNILHDMDLLTIESWLDSSVRDCYSLRVSIEGTNLGTNGKGVTRAYALASAYAELMERLQNQLVYTGKKSDDLKYHAGFYADPGEKYLSVEDILNSDEPWLKVFESVSRPEYDQGAVEDDLPDDPLAFFHSKAKEWFPDMFENNGLRDIVERWAKTNLAKSEGKFVGIPFYSLKQDRLTYIPHQILQAVYGSNGMAAGNTPEEALVQAVSEIFERYVCIYQFAEGKITSPDVPDSYLREYPYIYKMIKEIENAGPYRVIVKDCSLGRGFPVAGSVFIDYEHQTHIVKFGAHPDFGVALERTLTETFQGRNLKRQTFPEFYYCDDDLPGSVPNIRDIITTGAGLFPVEFFSEYPDYEFTPPKKPGETNRDMLRDMLGLLLDQGYDVLVRDASFLGFPACHVIVPGFSETERPDFLRAREILQFGEVRETVRRLDASPREAFEKAIPFIRNKKSSPRESALPVMFGLPIRKEFPKYDDSPEILLALACYKAGKFGDASREVSELINRRKPDSAYLKCMRDYMTAKDAGRSDQGIAALLNMFYAQDVVEKVISRLEAPDTLFTHFYHRPNCWDCANCEGRHACYYPNIEKVLKKLKERLAANPTDQLGNRAFFRELGI